MFALIRQDICVEICLKFFSSRKFEILPREVFWRGAGMTVANYVGLAFSFLELLCFAGVAFGYGFAKGYLILSTSE